MGSRSICLPTTDSDRFFYGWVIFHCMRAPHFLYALICWWTSGLPLHPGCLTGPPPRLPLYLCSRCFLPLWHAFPSPVLSSTFSSCFCSKVISSRLRGPVCPPGIFISAPAFFSFLRLPLWLYPVHLRLCQSRLKHGWLPIILCWIHHVNLFLCISKHNLFSNLMK